jgi:molybdopterin converting factor small subunit
MVEIRYYGVLTEMAGKTADNLEISEETTFSELKDILEYRYPGFGNYPIIFFQDSNHCSPDKIVVPGKEVDCMPPFSGG